MGYNPHGKGKFWGDMWRPVVTDECTMYCTSAQRTRLASPFAAARADNTCKVNPDYCMSVCSRYKRKTSWAINISTTNLVHVHIPLDSNSACVDPEVKRLKFKVTGLWSVPPAWVCTSAKVSCFHVFFYPRDAMLALYAAVFPSICLCVTRVLCIKTAKRFVVSWGLSLAICCPSGCTVASGVVVGVCNRSQMRTSKCTCLVFGVSIGLDSG